MLSKLQGARYGIVATLGAARWQLLSRFFRNCPITIMKKKILCSVLLGMLASPVLAQDTAIQVYGRLNLGLEDVRQHGGTLDDLQATRLSNYRSVLGFRGSEDLGGGLHLLFQIEGAVSPDTGSGAIASRDTRVGLAGRWGTIFGGNWATPYTSATASLDPFYPTTAGYMSIMGNGSAPSASNVSDKTSFDRRQQNSLHYWSPTWHGWSLRLAHGLNEEAPAGGAKPSLSSGALLFEHARLYAAAAYERHHAYQGPGLDDYAAKLAAAYQVSQTRLAAIVEKLHYETGSGHLDRMAYYLSVTQQIGFHRLQLGVAKANDGRGNAKEKLGFIQSGTHTGATQATLGYEYALSKRSSVFAFYARLRNEGHGVVDFAVNGFDAGMGSTLSATSLGIRHSF
jgi:predicted porin